MEQAKLLNFKPIGTFHTDKQNTYEAARQASADPCHSEGVIRLLPGQQFEQALIGLEKFSHLWIISCFSQNQHWKPMVLPPRGTASKVGVFASRSPYRPNPLGMSAVSLQRIEGLNIFVRGHDLLDQTPILDLKPYLAYADSIPLANSGWLHLQEYAVAFSANAEKQISVLAELGVSQLRGFILQQLQFEPTDRKRKRVIAQANHHFVLAYRTWRIEFHVHQQNIEILQIHSGYAARELLSLQEDPYLDKQIHLEFLSRQS